MPIQASQCTRDLEMSPLEVEHSGHGAFSPKMEAKSLLTSQGQEVSNGSFFRSHEHAENVSVIY
jgi:hypothetical protein